MRHCATAPMAAPKAKADVTAGDVVLLTQTLVQINSSNSDSGGVGEGAIASYIEAWLEHRGIETHRVEKKQGRPSIVGVVRGTGGGQSIMLNGHIDTVTLQGYHGDALNAHIEDGNMYGRGTADMKSGLAAQMIALASAQGKSLKGDVILAAVADEESGSLGTTQVLDAGWRADAAIIAEPTGMALVTSHKGIATFVVDIHGVASHGARPDLGVDAICKAGYFLVELDKHAAKLGKRDDQSTVDAGIPNIHCGIINGGEETNSYPATCTINIERRTVAGETAASVESELRVILDKLAVEVPGFKFSLRLTSYQAPYFIEKDHSFVRMVRDFAEQAMLTKPSVRGETFWTDMALLGEAGIPGLVWGPSGYGLHSNKEWVEVDSIKKVADGLINIIAEFCK